MRRNFGAALTAVALIGMLCWGYYKSVTQPDLISRTTIRSEVISSGKGWIKVEVEGDVYRVPYFQPPVPKEGDELPLIVEKYSDDTNQIRVDHQKLETEKHGVRMY